MSSLNKKPPSIHTHEGGVAQRVNAELELRRSVLACLLWEDSFYESGVSIAERIASLVPQVEAQKVHSLAVDARSKFKLRHMPLYLAVECSKYSTHKKNLAQVVEAIIQRPDELAEILALYAKDRKGTKRLNKLSRQIRLGVAAAFNKFNEYQFAKYNQDNAIKLKDALFLCHSKPKNIFQQGLFDKIVAGTLTTPDTWEVALSSGADKKATWERLLSEDKLGALALLRNLRNMTQVNVDEAAVRAALQGMKVERVLPFRFITAARYAPRFEDVLEQAMYKCLAGHPKLDGKTALLIDVSGSMDDAISTKSELTRIDAACGLAILIREIADQAAVYTFSERLCEIAPRRGFALRDAINSSQHHSSTYLKAAIEAIHSRYPAYDRLIVITDEQSQDGNSVPAAGKAGYLINVAAYKNGVGYGPWLHVDGWSEAVVDYIQALESEGLGQ
jgi:60 kDa SS-A/Ro ribonucleoprotein